MWQTRMRKKGLGNVPEIESEEVSQARFWAEFRPPILVGLIGGEEHAHRGGGNGIKDNAIDRMNSLAETLNPTVIHRHVGASESAYRLVKGIARLNDVSIFISTDADQATENEHIILDVFKKLKIEPKIVDVSSDTDMYLGLPQADGQADLPYLYIDGVAFGNIGTILDACRNCALIAALSAANVAFNADAAEKLRQR